MMRNCWLPLPLSLSLIHICASRVMEEEELMKVVRVKMPGYYQANDCHQLIHDFYAK